MPEGARARGAVYGRRLGRPLSPSRRAALETLLPALAVPEDDLVDPAALFPAATHVALEIGFGNGEHLLGLLNTQPESGFIGVEPFANGMSAFLKALPAPPPSNVRVHMGDAVALIDRMPDGCLDALYILNPDPWPKARHHKRRMIRPETLDMFARVLRPGAPLVMTTDVNALAAWMVAHAAAHPAFAWTARSKRDWAEPPPGWVETRYEAKGRAAGRRQTYLLFVRRAGAV
ncbi:MAG: tRNA (guanosine(46)-N7)-methyltransferase TrmB [Alphaproteobacteria bacterium]|jgi:tRNA (guanine-N7-)-methyltransferase|nr:tRNA (guanosine(46)-N7)-methyltransferase TrmB [Alphaproteobacteria bacterium]